MASGAGKGNFSSKFLNLIGGKKKAKHKDENTGSGESDDEGYIDPEGLCPTEPPREAIMRKPPVPDYPPPYPTSKTPSARPFSTIEFGSKQAQQMSHQTRSLEGGTRKSKPAVAEKPKAANMQRVDDYADPWDSKAKSLNTSLGAPAKPPHNQRHKDTYMDPYDSKNSTAPTKPPYKPATQTYPTGPIFNSAKKIDNYIEPWDSRSAPRDVKNHYKDDYKDPWDSKMPASLPKSSYEEEEYYTVPYDAGPKVKQPSKKGNGVKATMPVEEDIYDMTYEDQVAARALVDNAKATNKAAQQQKKTPKFVREDNYEEPWEYTAKNYPKPSAPTPSNTSAAPGKPKPPSDDYDAPWEWNNGALSKAMANLPPPSAKQTETSRDRVESSLTDKTRPAKPKRTQPPAESSAAAIERKMYEVDPTIPLENQNWYHGKIPRMEAEGLLRGLPDCSYLIRDSESTKMDYSLSLRNNNEPMHLKISCRGGKFILGQHSKPYDTIPEMIHNYSMNNLNIKGAEQVKLIYPVLQEAMYFTVEPGS